jgi:hypothetical protein
MPYRRHSKRHRHSFWRHLRRRRSRLDGLNSNFELMAASLPCLLLLLHLLVKAADPTPPAPTQAPGKPVAAEESDQVATQQVAVVPEPNSFALVGLGLAALAYRHRRQSTPA